MTGVQTCALPIWRGIFRVIMGVGLCFTDLLSPCFVLFLFLSQGLSFFLSPPIRISLTGLHMLQVTLQLSFSVSGRESPTVGPGHSPQLYPSHLRGITPTLPISLRESLSFGEIWLYCDLMKYFAIIYVFWMSL